MYKIVKEFKIDVKNWIEKNTPWKIESFGVRSRSSRQVITYEIYADEIS
jgi:hypothetical protein